MKVKRILYFLSIILLLIINIYFVIHRNEGYKYHPYKSYNELYVMDSSLYLKDLHFTEDSLQLTFSTFLSNTGYKLKVDSLPEPGPIIHSTKNSVIIPIRTGIHIYTLVPLDNSLIPLIVKTDHPAVKDSLLDYINEFLYCNVPGPGVQSMPLQLWQHGMDELSKDDQQKGIDLLRKSTNVFNVNSDVERALEIAKFVSKVPNAVDGKRPEKILDGNGWIQIETAMQERVKLNCGNYSKIVTYLCSILGMPNRIVSYFGPNGNWSYGVHYLNEVYLKDLQQWAVLDGTLNIYLPHDGTRFYNVADFKNIERTNSLKGKRVFTYRADTLIDLPADSVKENFFYYNQSNADLVFNYPGTGKRGSSLGLIYNFYSFNQDVAFYSDTNRNDWQKIILKLFAFYGLLLILLFFITEELRYYLNKK